MITCHNCGRVNDEAMRICRFCGTVLERPSAQPRAEVRDYAPPVDVGIPSSPQGVAPYSPPQGSAGYRCPNCGSTYPPITESRISAQGWIIFIVLLFVCLPLFWIGLLMKEEVRVCPMCRQNLA